MPDHLSATALRKAGPFFPPPLRRLLDRGARGPGNVHRLLARLRGVLRLLLGIGDALPLVLVQDRAQASGTSLQRALSSALQKSGASSASPASASGAGPARSRARLSLSPAQAPPGSGQRPPVPASRRPRRPSSGQRPRECRRTPACRYRYQRPWIAPIRLSRRSLRRAPASCSLTRAASLAFTSVATRARL